MTEEEKAKQKALSESLGLGNRKVNKVYWSEIAQVKFESKSPETLFFKYKYEEDYRTAPFSLPRRELRKKEIYYRQKKSQKYLEPCGVAIKKKEDLQNLCYKGLIPSRHHSFYNNLHVSGKQK